jgi:hypothetical protein
MNSVIHILDCIPKRPRGGKVGESWVLIPAYAWQVKLSIEHKTDLNAFEELVLKLLKNANYTTAQLAKMTHLHEDLIDWIRESLANKSLLTESDSTEGIERSPTTDLIGWVLQDPETGSIFSYFSADFKPFKVNANIQANGLIDLEFGDDDNAYTKWASLLLHPSQIPTVPDIQNIIQILNRKSSNEYKARLANLTTLVPEGFIEPKSNYPLKNKYVNRVSFMGNTPSKVWLPTAGVVMKKKPNEWFMCDPVGDGWSKQIKLRIERFEKEGNHTASQLIKVLYGKTTQSDFLQGIDLKENYNLAQQRLTSAFGSRIFDFDAVANQMGYFFASWLILDKFGNQQSINEIEDVCTRGRKVLEALFKQLAKNNPLLDLSSLLVGKNTDNKHFHLVKQHAVEMGYTEDSLVTGVILVSKSWIKQSAEDLSTYYMLSKVIGGLLLQASTQDDHPFRLAAKKAPNLFTEIEFICLQGNPAAHDNSHKPKDQQTVNIEKALSLKDKLINVVRLLLDPEGKIFN